MQQSTDRILTTHAGSLPRPDDVAQTMYDVLAGKAVDSEALDKRVTEAVAEIVARQREIGIDVVSDGEVGKVGFSNYVIQSMSGFVIPESTGAEGGSGFVPTDIMEVPEVAAEAFGSEGARNVRSPILNGPIEARDTHLVEKEIEDLRAALGDVSPDEAFIPAVTPGQLAFQFANHYYDTHREYVEAAAKALAPEYRAIVDAGFNLQLDSPDSAMAWHCAVEGVIHDDLSARLGTAIEVLNQALEGIPAEKVRYHVCWGNYAGTHHNDVPLTDIIDLILGVNGKFLYVEAANPRHEHEWRVWKDIPLPDDKVLIAGVIDTKTNAVEHPELVAERIERLAGVVGRERVVAATDCGFSTFVGFHSCNPAAAWRKLESLVSGAELASGRLWN